MIFSFAALGVGIAALVITIMFRKGTPAARGWIRNDGLVDARFAFLFMPGFTLLMLGMGAAPHYVLFPKIMHGPYIILAGIVGLVGLIVMIWGVIPVNYPKFFTPQWYSDHDKKKGRTNKR